MTDCRPSLDSMRPFNSDRLVCIMERTLNLIDLRLVNHGKRVAYSLFKALYPLQLYTDEELRDICILGLLHDVGAYKTEDVNAIIGFEQENAWDHSIYGYLFLKYFSPINKLSPAVAFHHADDSRMISLSKEIRMFAHLLKDHDRADILRHADTGFMPLHDITIDEDEEFSRVYRNTPFTTDEAESFLRMIVFSIDFRSPQTMLHTFAASHVAESLAKLIHLDINQINRLKFGALIHDIGKMGTPLHILEGTSEKLSESDMIIMRKHVVLSEVVLQGCVDEDILNIAINHHEKLNGKGYPKNLVEADLPLLDRIMAVADTFSAMCVSRKYQQALPKDKVVEILNRMKDRGLFERKIIELAVDNYDFITKHLDINTKSIISLHEDIASERRCIHNKIANGNFDIIN